MKVSELIKGNYYYVEERNGFDKGSCNINIFLYEGNPNRCKSLVKCIRSYKERYITHLLRLKSIRLADSEEINHMNLCIEKNSYVKYKYSQLENYSTF